MERGKQKGLLGSIVVFALLLACTSGSAPQSCSPDPCDQDGDGYKAKVGFTATNYFGFYRVTSQQCYAQVYDCDDKNPSVSPGAPEVCDGIDNNCNGQIDEGVGQNFYQDLDGDGYGNPAVSAQACTAPAGYVSDNTDCDDGAPLVNPGAVELCDGLDNNCNGQIDEGVKLTFYNDLDGDGYGDAAAAMQACIAPAGFVLDNADCSDANSLVNPGAPEICDGIDDNCDGQLGETEGDQDRDGFFACSECDDNNPQVHPGAAELCNGVDDDCDGSLSLVETQDLDGDGIVACQDCNEQGGLCDQLTPPAGARHLQVTLIEASAGLMSDIYLFQPVQKLLIPHNLDNVGQSVAVNLDGSALTFFIRVNGVPWGIGVYDHYSSDSQYVRINQIDANSYTIGFEDLPADMADFDFNDVVLLLQFMP